MMRAIDRALEATVSVRARALTQSELRRALDATSLPRELVGEIAATMTTLESARFATGATPSVEKCAELVEEILRHRSRAASESASTTERG